MICHIVPSYIKSNYYTYERVYTRDFQTKRADTKLGFEGFMMGHGVPK